MDAYCPKCRCKDYYVNSSFHKGPLLWETCSCDSCGTVFNAEYELGLLKVERADEDVIF